MRVRQPTTPVVDAISEINLEGNITPNSWYGCIRKPNGKVDLLAIDILSDIVWYYRATEERDEHTGQTIGRFRKFEKDMLQRSYGQLAEMFSVSKRQAKRSVDLLVKLGLLRRELRTIVDPRGVVDSNVLFLEPVPEAIRRITFRVGGRQAKRPRWTPPGRDKQLFH